jgi:hypothetical protein
MFASVACVLVSPLLHIREVDASDTDDDAGSPSPPTDESPAPAEAEAGVVPLS